MQIKNIVFDFGQVLVHFDPKYMVGQYVTDAADAALLAEVVFDRLYWSRLDAGTISDEEVLEACRTRLPERLWESASTIYYNWIYNLPEVNGMRELVKYLKARYGVKLLVLSDISHYFADHYTEIPILSEFSHRVFSAEYGYVKPSREIFEILCHTGNIRPEETIFIDDRADNIAGAEAFGIRGYVFDQDAAKLKKYLDQLLSPKVSYQVPYQKENKIHIPIPGEAALDGEIGRRFDRFIHERVSGKFAIDEILREAEECIRDKYDDEYCLGLWRCEFWGKLILSASRVCRLKQDDTLKEDIRRSVYRILQYQDKTGYLGSYQNRENIFQADSEQCLREVGSSFGYNWNVWGQKYTLWALLECAQLLDDPHILTCCKRLADQLIDLLSRLGVRLKDAGVMHGMPAGSIMKPMLLLYRLTGDRKYYDFCENAAKEWEREDNECPNLIANALSNVPPAHWYPLGATTLEGWIAKAYEMMSCFDGLIELYRINGNTKYLDAVKAFWASTQKDEENILGSVGYCERFASAASYPDAATEICDVIHWMRLSHELFCLTGEAKYMEAFEKAFLNAFLAGIYEDCRSGAFFVRSAGRHLIGDWQVESKYQHCCLNNAPRAFVNAAESVVMKAADGFYINLYTQARVRFGETSFRIGTGYADNGTVAITVRSAAAGQNLYLRIPAWSKITTITVVGGETFETKEAGTYFVLPLSDEDQVIRLTFDMTPEIMDFAGTFRSDLPDTDYHILRWPDDQDGLCGREQMLQHPMSVIRRGPLMLARSKRVGCKEDDMFSGETVFGKERTVNAHTIRHDGLQTLCRVDISCAGKEYHYVMCDYASAANRDLEDVRYFNMYV